MIGRGKRMVKLALQSIEETDHQQIDEQAQIKNHNADASILLTNLCTEEQDNKTNLEMLHTSNNQDNEKVKTFVLSENGDCIFLQENTEVSELFPVQIEIDNNLNETDLTDIIKVGTHIHPEVLKIINLNDNNMMILEDNDIGDAELQFRILNDTNNDNRSIENEILNNADENQNEKSKDYEFATVENENLNTENENQGKDNVNQNEESADQDSGNKDSLSANEFSSCLVDYILELPDTFKHVVLISDGCCSQNRNKILSTALSDTARQKNIIIEQLYLQRGHTMMEADNVHATLEHYFKPPIYSPTDYISRMHLARPEKPYDIKVVHYDFFLNYSKMDSVFPSIRPGIGVGEKCVTDICKIKYMPDGAILIKTDFTQDWQILPHRRQIIECFKGLQDLYTNEIPLKQSKYNDLQSLKSVIDRQYHDFYDKLPFKADNKRKNIDNTPQKKKAKK